MEAIEVNDPQLAEKYAEEHIDTIAQNLIDLL